MGLIKKSVMKLFPLFFTAVFAGTGHHITEDILAAMNEDNYITDIVDFVLAREHEVVDMFNNGDADDQAAAKEIQAMFEAFNHFASTNTDLALIVEHWDTIMKIYDAYDGYSSGEIGELIASLG